MQYRQAGNLGLGARVLESEHPEQLEAKHRCGVEVNMCVLSEEPLESLNSLQFFLVQWI